MVLSIAFGHEPTILDQPQGKIRYLAICGIEKSGEIYKFSPLIWQGEKKELDEYLRKFNKLVEQGVFGERLKKDLGSNFIFYSVEDENKKEIVFVNGFKKFNKKLSRIEVKISDAKSVFVDLSKISKRLKEEIKK